MSARKILVIDDSELMQRMYRMLLAHHTRHGAEVIEAFNGQEGLDALCRCSDIDLVLLDINMPVMSGLQFLERMRDEPIFNHIPVIIISTEGSESDTMRGLRAGATAYVKKPFDGVTLSRLIEEVARRGSAARPAEPVDGVA